MEGPKKIKPQKLADYLEQMSKSVFQAGISWKVVEAKWPGIREAFRGFDPAVVSRFTINDIDTLVQDTRIIRNRRKIEAVVLNAQRMIDLDGRFGGFQRYLRSFASYDELSADLRKQFKFIGDMGAYHFLWTVGEKVPSWEEWSERHMVKA